MRRIMFACATACDRVVDRALDVFDRVLFWLGPVFVTLAFVLVGLDVYWGQVMFHSSRSSAIVAFMSAYPR